MKIKIDNFYTEKKPEAFSSVQKNPKSKQGFFCKKKLSNELVILFEKRNLPVVAIASCVNFGGGFEFEKEKGIAHLIEHMLFKGTKKRSYEEIASEIEKKGGVLNGFTGEEITAFWNKLPSRHLATGIDIASDLILNPVFKEEEFEKEKKVIIDEIKMHHDNPVYYVHDKIKSLLYEKPFGISIAGTIEGVKSLTREKVIEFFNKHYKTNKMTLCLVGNADFEEIVKKAEKNFPKTKAEFTTPEIIKRSEEIVEKRKGLDQAHFIFGFHVPSLMGKARRTYEIALTYLAGGMSSILFNEIRGKRGLAYDIRADIDCGKNYGFTTIYAGAKKEAIKEIREIILREIKNLKNIKQKDLEETKEQLIGLREVEEEDSTKVMTALISEESGKGAEEYYKFEEKIGKIKLEDIRKIRLREFSSLALIPE